MLWEEMNPSDFGHRSGKQQALFPLDDDPCGTIPLDEGEAQGPQSVKVRHNSYE